MAFAVLTVSCKDGSQNQGENIEMEAERDTTETSQAQNQERVLFDGENLEGWKAYNRDQITQWKVEDSAIAFSPSEGRQGSENIITEDEFTNFELSLEYKIAEGGNSGIMWGVQEDQKFNEPYLTGPEIQVLDNQRHPDAQNGPIRQTGALYDMSEPSQDVTKPAGEWNQMTIRINYEENQGTVTVNGTQVNQFPLHGEEWNKLVENSKFKDWESFGKERTGHIALQDHGDKVWYRNIRIKELE